MSDIHHLEPITAHRLERRNPLTDAIDQDLATPTRDGSQAGQFEVSNNLFEGLVEDFTEMNELARTKAVNVYRREFGFDMGKQIEIPLFSQFRMMAALHENLGAAQSDRLLNFSVNFIEGDDIGVVIFFGAVEGAEFAIDIADVGVIDVAVDDVG